MNLKIINITVKSFPLLLLILFFQQSAQAGDRLGGINIGVENFNWKEFNEQKKLVEESGDRYFVSIVNDRSSVVKKGFISTQEIRFYGGDVDYQGHFQNIATGELTPHQNTTNYSGFAIDGNLGLRINVSILSWDFLLGANLDGWTRDIKNSTTPAGELVQGYKEQYNIFAANISTGPAWVMNKWQGSLLFGVKMPFYTNETIDPNGVNLKLKPYGQSSMLLKFHNLFSITKKFSLLLDVYYDSYRFGKSDEEVLKVANGYLAFYQPESTQDTYGVALGISGLF